MNKGNIVKSGTGVFVLSPFLDLREIAIRFCANQTYGQRLYLLWSKTVHVFLFKFWWSLDFTVYCTGYLRCKTVVDLCRDDCGFFRSGFVRNTISATYFFLA